MTNIRVENISKKFINHQALNDVSLEVNEGKIFGLLGPNGAGKTTLIRILNQIVLADSGSVYFDGEKLNPKHSRIIGYLPEERGLYKKMKIREQALYLVSLRGVLKRELNPKIDYWFDKFDLKRWEDKKVEDLSKGMAQKLQFIITILHDPKLLIFDEPFSGFDPINANMVKDEILEFKKKGCTIIFSTHNMSSVEEICDDIALINKSQKILDGNLHDIKQQYKSNVFVVKMLKNKDIQQSDFFKIIAEKEENEISQYEVKLENSELSNKLITHFVEYGKIIGFEEKIPTMNEIFIRVVNENTSSVVQ